MTQGRASTPEAEEARREKIRRAVLQRGHKLRDDQGRFVTREKFLQTKRARAGIPAPKFATVVIQTNYRVKNRKVTEENPQREGWHYESGHEYVERIPLSIADKPEKLRGFLNARHNTRVHFGSTRVVEYL